MYYSHFGLNQAPFKITPNTEFFFSGGNRGPILEALIYAVTSGEGIIKVTGEVGSGKTMLCNMLQTRLPAHIETVYLQHPSVAPEEILHAIAFELQLGVDRSAPRLEIMHLLQDYLLKRHAEGKRVVVFVEESQSMPLATLEEIRLLSNLETRDDKLLQIVLFGQPELDDNLRRPNIRQLRERITHGFRLEPLTADEIREYLMFRMRAAGYHGPDLFSSPVVRLIARASGGLTRRVNVIADKALLAAFSENTHNIRPRHIRAAVRDSEFSEFRLRAAGSRLSWAAALMLSGAAIGAVIYALISHSGRSGMQDAATTAPTTPVVERAAPATISTPIPAHGDSGTTSTSGPEERPSASRVGPARDLVAQRLAATRAWLANAQETTYSIQLLLAASEEQLTRHLNDISKFVELNEVFLYRTEANSRASLAVLYGRFSDRQAAQDALEKLPPVLKANQPFLRTVRGIRTEIERQQRS